MQNTFGNEGIDIVEIGGGYGGLCLCLHYFAPSFDINIKSYTIIDLTDVLRLQKMYLNSNGIQNVNFEDTVTYGKNIDKKNMFFISNYAFTELHRDKQNQYLQDLFPKVKHGFMCWNMIDYYDFGFKTYVIDEIPKTGQYNKYVFF